MHLNSSVVIDVSNVKNSHLHNVPEYIQASWKDRISGGCKLAFPTPPTAVPPRFLTALWEPKSKRRQWALAEKPHQSETLCGEAAWRIGEKNLLVWVTVKKPWKPYPHAMYNLQHTKHQICFEKWISWLIPHALSQQMNQEFTSVKHFSFFCRLKATEILTTLLHL